jgi:hypothetical protein
MDENDRFDSSTPKSATPDDVEPFEPKIVEATPVPEYIGDATPPLGATTPDAYANAPTEAIPVVERVVPPVVAPTAVSPAAYAPAAPVVVPHEPPYPERNPGWPYFLAFVALLAGGLVGYLIAIAMDDDDEAGPVATVPVTTQVLVTEPGDDADTDAIIDDLQAQVLALTAAQEDAAGLTDQITDLEAALADMTAERDALAAEIENSDSSGTDQQAALDAANEQIAVLEAQLATAIEDLETANENAAEAESALATAVGERDEAVAALEDLNVIPNPNFVNGPVTRARTDAAANGWTLIEQPTDSASAAAGTVLEQAPPAGTNMIDGSVLYVTVAEAP